jgi:predicted nucleic acid-binding protein
MIAGYLLDSSFVIAFLREVESKERGDARQFLAALPRRSRTFVSVISYAEVLEAAKDIVALAADLRALVRFQGLGQDTAERVVLLQQRAARRMGENDAWIAATAIKGRLTLVGDDDEAFSKRPQLDYTNFRRRSGRSIGRP